MSNAMTKWARDGHRRCTKGVGINENTCNVAKLLLSDHTFVSTPWVGQRRMQRNSLIELSRIQPPPPVISCANRVAADNVVDADSAQRDK